MVDMNQTCPPPPNARRLRCTPIVYGPMGAVVAAVAALVGLRPMGGAFVLLGWASLVPESTDDEAAQMPLNNFAAALATSALSAP
jgi:hypothetical protein